MGHFGAFSWSCERGPEGRLAGGRPSEEYGVLNDCDTRYLLGLGVNPASRGANAGRHPGHATVFATNRLGPRVTTAGRREFGVVREIAFYTVQKQG
jgi:hypothetical protein